MEKKQLDTRIRLINDDITKLKVDAIVNAANNSLLGGGGVDGAIHKAGGRQILDECVEIRSRQGGCKTGEAVITSGGKLPAKFVIHTVGPVWQGGNNGEEELLAGCYINSLKLAVKNNVRTIAFPNISTGVYKFPKRPAAEIALREVNSFLSTNDTLEEVLFVCFGEENFDIYSEMIMKNSSK